MQVGHAATRRIRRPFVHDAAPQGRASRANDLRHGAAQIVGADAVDAPQGAEQPLASGCAMCRRDADNRAAGDDEHHGEIRERGNGSPKDLLNGAECDAGHAGRGGRSRRSNPHPLVHGDTSTVA